MAVYQLENEHIYLEVASHGAELVRLVGKKTKKEYLFDGDPKYWKRHSPILFPFVGGVKNKEYRYNGKTYTMTQHGFARDMEFTDYRKGCRKIRRRTRTSDFPSECGNPIYQT